VCVFSLRSAVGYVGLEIEDLMQHNVTHTFDIQMSMQMQETTITEIFTSICSSAAYAMGGVW
jgi:hypothetical protein